MEFAGINCLRTFVPRGGINAMNSTTPIVPKGRRIKVALIVSVVCIVVAAAVYWFGLFFEFEYPFWPTLYLAEQTKTPDGSRVTDLIRIRSGSSYVHQHWHHCTFCDGVYPYAPHLAIRVTGDFDEMDFYLFDWDSSHRRLLPISVRTAKMFPELIPSGYVVKPLGVGLNPQLYHNDEPCLIVLASSITTAPSK
jgi:hypothetical protein